MLRSNRNDSSALVTHNVTPPTYDVKQRLAVGESPAVWDVVESVWRECRGEERSGYVFIIAAVQVRVADSKHGFHGHCCYPETRRHRQRHDADRSQRRRWQWPWLSRSHHDARVGADRRVGGRITRLLAVLATGIPLLLPPLPPRVSLNDGVDCKRTAHSELIQVEQSLEMSLRFPHCTTESACGRFGG